MKDVDLTSLGAAIGIVGGLWAFAKLVLKPVVRALWREVHAEEVAKWDEMAKLSQSNADRLEWIEESINRQGASAKEQEDLVRAISRDVNQIIGRLEGLPGGWDGQTERRRNPRRNKDDRREA